MKEGYLAYSVRRSEVTLVNKEKQGRENIKDSRELISRDKCNAKSRVLISSR